MAAFDFSKINFFNRLGARARVFVLFGGVLVFILLVYLGTKFFGGGAKTVGPSHVANAPAGMQSIPGGTSSTAEYQRALVEANEKRAQAAKMTGTSAIPTQINTGMASFTTTGCIVCEEQNANVKNLLDDMVRKGLSPDIANDLESLADKNVPPEDYAASLSKLVQEGKLSPDQARSLLDEYKKQHTNALLKESGKAMDDLIKSGQLPLDVASQLLNDQKNKASINDYSGELQKLVGEGKISPAVAQQLLSQYSKQCSQQAGTKNIGFINQMVQNGSVTRDVAKDLSDLTNRDVPVDAYSNALSRFISQGKLTPDAAGKLGDTYRQGKVACGGVSALDNLLKQAENAAYQEISDLLAAKKITPDVAQQLTSLIQNNASLDDYKATVTQLLAQKKLTPEIAQLKMNDYEKVKQLRDEQQRLANLQANNSSAAQYADELKSAVAAGILTPDQAAQMMQEYQNMLAKNAIPVAPTGPTTGQFAALQQKVAAGAAAPTLPTATVAPQFAAAQAEIAQETEQARAARLESLVSAMSGQAQQLIGSWQPTEFRHVGNSEPVVPKEPHEAGGKEGAEGSASSSSGEIVATGAPIIKGGTIIFAVLDTEVNSDYPDSPVLATVVEGKLKGAKLLGKLNTAKSVSGQLDRISLNFTVMNFDPWPKSKSITAYAIDPDTARTVLASQVNYHYMQRFGAMMATSFLQGYSSAITNAGTSTTGIFGTSTTHPQLSPSNKLMVGLGQVGQTLGNATQNYINLAPTVKVDSGVSLGILFMSDVT